MTYREALTYLDSLINYEKKTDYDYKESIKLDRMRRLLGLLDNPHKGIRSIHVAGTKGKGSTAAIIHSILMSAEYKTGLYTSPHLVSFRERIRVGDELISEGSISALLEKVKGAVEKMYDERPSFFEVYTAVAFLYFRQEGVDFAVYETGLGGRLDATNIVEPLVAVITPISYEHTDKLGDTLALIANEKAGIIKAGCVCISAPQEKEALGVIENRCSENGVKLMLVGRDITLTESGSSEDGELFSVKSFFDGYIDLETRLLGGHQLENAAAAIGAAEALRYHDIVIRNEAIRAGVSSAAWPGRFEIVGKRPYVVLDGAQNRASARALAAAVKRIFGPDKKRYERLILVFGISNDKDIAGVLEEVAPISDTVIITKAKVAGRAAEPLFIEKKLAPIKGAPRDIQLTAGVGEALDRALRMAGERGLVVVTGSLFVVGEAREILVNPS